MKLLLCTQCYEIRSLYARSLVECGCGASWGRYLDQIHVECDGPAIILGVDNHVLCRYLRDSLESGEIHVAEPDGPRITLSVDSETLYRYLKEEGREIPDGDGVMRLDKGTAVLYCTRCPKGGTREESWRAHQMDGPVPDDFSNWARQ